VTKITPKRITSSGHQPSNQDDSLDELISIILLDHLQILTENRQIFEAGVVQVPPSPWGYFARKSFECRRLEPGCAAKILYPWGLPLKYLF
jgi:hypothetical protein